MADALLFWRDEGSKKTNPNFTDPNDLPADQKMVFTLPEELLESVSLVHENNIKDAPVSNPAGVRKVNKQDNGLQGLTLTFRGRFKDPSFEITQSQRFARKLQVENNFHQFGIFGFQASNTTETPFNFDPDDEFGLSIKKLTISRVGGKPKNFDFEFILTSGGTLSQT